MLLPRENQKNKKTEKQKNDEKKKKIDMMLKGFNYLNYQMHNS